MTLKVNVVPNGYILVDTVSHKTIGVFTSKSKAERRRRFINQQRRRMRERRNKR